MYSSLEIIGLATCVLIGSLLCISVVYEIKNSIQKLIKRLSEQCSCPNCGCIPLGYKSKRTGRKWSSEFCPCCGCRISSLRKKEHVTVCDTCAMSEEDRDVCWKTCGAAVVRVKTKEN